MEAAAAPPRDGAAADERDSSLPPFAPLSGKAVATPLPSAAIANSPRECQDTMGSVSAATERQKEVPAAADELERIERQLRDLAAER